MAHAHFIAIVDDDTSSGRHIPIVFVTGYPDDSSRTKAMQSGAVCFLTKPFDEGDLLDGLRTALTPGPA